MESASSGISLNTPQCVFARCGLTTVLEDRLPRFSSMNRYRLPKRDLSRGLGEVNRGSDRASHKPHRRLEWRHQLANAGTKAESAHQ